MACTRGLSLHISVFSIYCSKSCNNTNRYYILFDGAFQVTQGHFPENKSTRQHHQTSFKKNQETRLFQHGDNVYVLNIFPQCNKKTPQKLLSFHQCYYYSVMTAKIHPLIEFSSTGSRSPNVSSIVLKLHACVCIYSQNWASLRAPPFICNSWSALIVDKMPSAVDLVARSVV